MAPISVQRVADRLIDGENDLGHARVSAEPRANDSRRQGRARS